jgi:hypothetical protein
LYVRRSGILRPVGTKSTRGKGRPPLPAEERKAARLEFRLPQESRDRLERAAAVLKITLTEFVLEPALRRALRVLGRHKQP